VRIVPVREIQRLYIYFLLPPQQELYLKKPTSYFAHLLGHEAPGSLLHYLKEQGAQLDMPLGFPFADL
jgi:insulysin